MNMSMRTACTALLCIAAPLCAPATANAADGEDWEWLVVPYGWAASIGTDLNTRLPPSASSPDTDFADIIDKLDGAFQIHIEGQNERFGMFTDFTYIGLGDTHDHPRFDIDSDLDARLFELAGVWSPGESRYRGLDLFAGLRYIDADFTTRLEPVDPVFPTVTVDAGESFSDFMLGARYTWPLAERWNLTLRGDGSFGDTDGTWNASAVVQYRTGNGAWAFGYRHLDAEFESDGNRTNISMSGPEIGYAFRF